MSDFVRIPGITLRDGVSENARAWCSELEMVCYECETDACAGAAMPLTEAALDQRFGSVRARVEAGAAEGPDRTAALMRIDELWSALTLRLIVRDGSTRADIVPYLRRAQIVCCWAAGDGDMV